MSLPRRKIPLSESLGMAIRLISDPKTWCQGEMAKDKHRRRVDVCSPRAAKFCMLGAISRALHNENPDVYKGSEFVAITEVVKDQIWKSNPAMKHGGIAFFNDDASTTHFEVMRVMGAALLALRRKEGGIVRAAATRRKNARRRKN